MSINQWKKIVFLFLPLLIVACGSSGGGGNGGGGQVDQNSYNGKTTQATVTAANARSLSVDAYQGGMSGSELGVIGVAKDGSHDSKVPTPQCMLIATTLEGSVVKVLSTSTHALTKSKSAIAEDTIEGAVSGSAYLVINNVGINGVFSGIIDFDAYSDVIGRSIDGEVSFSGVYSLTTETFSEISIDFTSIEMTEDGISYRTGGSVAMDQDGNMKISLVLKNNNKTYWVKDYVFTYSSGSPETLTITGTYYDYDHGYVTITTTVPIEISSTEEIPTTGTMIFTGANGSKVRLTFGAAGYAVAVDTGNGIFVPVP